MKTEKTNAELMSRLRKGFMASAGFVRDSKNPDAQRAMSEALDALEDVELHLTAFDRIDC